MTAPLTICRLPERPRGRCFDQPYTERFRAESTAANSRRTDQYVYAGGQADLYIARMSVPTVAGVGVRLRDSEDRDRISAPMSVDSEDVSCTFTPAVRIPRGGRLALEVWNSSVAAEQLTFQLDGYRRFYEDKDSMDLTYNPYAPPITAGMNDGSTPPGWNDDSYIYVFPPNNGTVAAGASLLGQPFRIANDADFIWRGLGAALSGAGAEEVSIRWTDGLGRWRMNSPIPLNLLTEVNIETPRPIFTEIHLQASAAPLFDIVNASASNATSFQLWLFGVKRSKR